MLSMLSMPLDSRKRKRDDPALFHANVFVKTGSESGEATTTLYPAPFLSSQDPKNLRTSCLGLCQNTTERCFRFFPSIFSSFGIFWELWTSLGPTFSKKQITETNTVPSNFGEGKEHVCKYQSPKFLKNGVDIWTFVRNI